MRASRLSSEAGLAVVPSQAWMEERTDYDHDQALRIIVSSFVLVGLTPAAPLDIRAVRGGRVVLAFTNDSLPRNALARVKHDACA